MTIYTDAYLNHYADRYIALGLSDQGISLEQYLADPGRYSILQAIPPAWADWAPKEPLKHHRRPKNQKRGRYTACFQKLPNINLGVK